MQSSVRTTGGDRPRPEAKNGFTLLEMLVASTLFMVIMLTMLALFNSQSKVGRQNNQRVDILANARAAMDMITKDLRVAGAGLADGAAYTFVNGDFPTGADVAGDGLVSGGDDFTRYPDYIAIMYVPGEGSPCQFSLGTVSGGTMQAANLPVDTANPAELAKKMCECGQSYKPQGTQCSDFWVVESQDGTVQTIIEARSGASGSPADCNSPNPPYMTTAISVNILHTPDAQSEVNLPQGLPGTPRDPEVYSNGRIRLANDIKFVGYRIAGVGTDHPTLQRKEGNQCTVNFTNAPWINVAENIEDLQISFAYLDPAGDDNNITGTLQTDVISGTAPFFRPPQSYDTPADAISHGVGDTPHRIRYTRVSLLARADQPDVSRRNPRFDLAGLGVPGRPLFYGRPTIEDHTGSVTSDGRARVFLQEVVDVRNRNLPAI